MQIPPFRLERYFAQYEFSARYLLSSSDCEALSLAELLQMANRESKKLWDELLLGYTETAGHPLLRKMIAATYQGITADDVLVAVPSEAIFLAAHALLEPGDHIVCCFPAYQSLYEVARTIGCEVSIWQAEEEQGWHFNVKRLEEKLQSNTKLVIVNFPHNPTGYVPMQEEYQALVNIVCQRGIYLLSDEMYRPLEVEPGTTLPAACELYERALSLSGLSKVYGLPGLRIGWVASHSRDVLASMSRLKDYTTICASAPSEILAIIALQNREAIIARQLERIQRNIAVLDKFFDEHQDFFAWHRPRGGSICLPRLLGEQNADDFCQQLIDKTGILLAPASVFQFGERHVRMGFGRENLPQAIARLDDYLNDVS